MSRPSLRTTSATSTSSSSTLAHNQFDPAAKRLSEPRSADWLILITPHRGPLISDWGRYHQAVLTPHCCFNSLSLLSQTDLILERTALVFISRWKPVVEGGGKSIDFDRKESTPTPRWAACNKSTSPHTLTLGTGTLHRFQDRLDNNT